MVTFDWDLFLAMRVHTKTGLLFANTIRRLNGVIFSVLVLPCYSHCYFSWSDCSFLLNSVT